MTVNNLLREVLLVIVYYVVEHKLWFIIGILLIGTTIIVHQMDNDKPDGCVTRVEYNNIDDTTSVLYVTNCVDSYVSINNGIVFVKTPTTGELRLFGNVEVREIN